MDFVDLLRILLFFGILMVFDWILKPLKKNKKSDCGFFFSLASYEFFLASNHMILVCFLFSYEIFLRFSMYLDPLYCFARFLMNHAQFYWKVVII